MPITRKILPVCPIERTLAILSGRWKARIVWQLRDAPKRYSTLEQEIPGLAQRVLTQALRELAQDGVVYKVDERWSLTSIGEELGETLASMWIWGTKHQASGPAR